MNDISHRFLAFRFINLTNFVLYSNIYSVTEIPATSFSNVLSILWLPAGKKVLNVNILMANL